MDSTTSTVAPVATIAFSFSAPINPGARADTR
jgi:hypothetical protein